MEFNRDDYPVMQGPSPDAGGAAITFELLGKTLAYFKSPEYRERLEESERYYAEQRRWHWEQMEQWWLRQVGATEMTPQLKEQFQDELWESLVRHTNILEVLS